MIESFNFLSNSRGEAVDHMSVSDDNQIQPTTASLPPCGHTNLVTSCLQQLSNCLKFTDKYRATFYFIISDIHDLRLCLWTLKIHHQCPSHMHSWVQ